MKKLLALLLIPTAALAEPVTITEDVVKACAEVGGCVVILPDGMIIPRPQFDQVLKEMQQNAYRVGVEVGRKEEEQKQKACSRNNT